MILFLEPKHSNQAKDRDVMNSLGFSVHCVSWLRWVMLSGRCSWPSTKNHQEACFVMGSDAFERVTVRKTVHWTIGPDVLNRTRFPHTHTHRVKQEALMLRGTSWILGPEQFWAASRCSHNCIPIQTPSKNYGEGSCWSCFSGSIPPSKCTQSSVDYAIHKSLTTKQKVIKDKSSSRRNFQTKLGSLGVSHGPTQFQRYRARPKSKASRQEHQLKAGRHSWKESNHRVFLQAVTCAKPACSGNGKPQPGLEIAYLDVIGVFILLAPYS